MSILENAKRETLLYKQCVIFTPTEFSTGLSTIFPLKVDHTEPKGGWAKMTLHIPANFLLFRNHKAIYKRNEQRSRWIKSCKTFGRDGDRQQYFPILKVAIKAAACHQWFVSKVSAPRSSGSLANLTWVTKWVKDNCLRCIQLQQFFGWFCIMAQNSSKMRKGWFHKCPFQFGLEKCISGPDWVVTALHEVTMGAWCL